MPTVDLLQGCEVTLSEYCQHMTRLTGCRQPVVQGAGYSALTIECSVRNPEMRPLQNATPRRQRCTISDTLKRSWALRL
jgi:hypothetical protein